MSRFDRAVGFARSLAIYHAVPGRQRQLRRLYATFVRSGDVMFDVGAHVGNHARACAALGCRVVALEPQPDFARWLRLLFRASNVVVLESAVGGSDGRASLAVSERTPTVTSLARDWLDERAREPGFEGVRWNRRVEIDTVTLDTLIARHGLPAFVKIDVEGAEPTVLAGLSQAVPALSFEYLPGALEQVEECLARLRTLGAYGFNWSVGESHHFASEQWLTEQDLLSQLRAAVSSGRSGDVYAKLMSV